MSLGRMRMLAGCLVLTCVMTVTSAQCSEPSTTVVVVASVFSTLAVVFLVLGIIAFLLWRRRRGLSSPPDTPSKKNHLQEVRDVPSPEGGLSNPAFSDPDASLVEQGVSYVHCREYEGSPEKSKSSQSNGGKDMSKKTWASLPMSDVPGLTRNGSVGSLDDGLMSMDPEVTSVWLQSQDFIGLGFNIAGSMRDGIFVSQVHNRGPAIESGKFKVGDRIQSVTISFANMVFEDALTILSYASPYPVKVTLQKEKLRPKDQRLNDHSTRLTHPLYRSQSVDTLLKINRQTKVTPKRSFSEMRSETRKDTSPVKKNAIHVKQSTVPEESQSSEILATEIPQIKVIPAKNINLKQSLTSPDVVVHKSNIFHVENETQNVELRNKEHKKLTPAVKFMKDVDESESPVAPIPEATTDTTDAVTTRDFVDVFDKLNEEDKLDMLRLSYEEPNTSANESIVTPEINTSVDSSLPNFEMEADSTGTGTDYVNIELRLPAPTKPERRKKKNSSDDGSEPGTPGEFNGIPPELLREDLLPAISMVTEFQPEIFSNTEISEDFIVAENHDRNINVSSQSFELSPIASQSEDVTVEDLPNNLVPDLGPPPPIPNEDMEDGGGDFSQTLVDYSLSDMESTLTKPQTPELGVPIEEDMIMPQLLSKDPLEAMAPRLFSPPDGTAAVQESCCDDKKSVSPSEDRNENTAEINKDLSGIDFSLNMTSDPNLFSTPFPSRNTKERTSGLAYDISVQELESMELAIKKDEHVSGDGKGGVAYVIRDDVTSGAQQTMSYEKSVASRAMSYAGSEFSPQQLEQKQRTGSLKENKKLSKDDESDLDWSGKRLVRSELFSDIPQNDSIHDWTEYKTVDENTLVLQSSDQDNSVNSSDENLNDIDNPRLTRANIFRARENLANLSDNSDSMVLTSESTSHSGSSTPPPPYTTANGDNEVSVSPDTTPTKTPIVLMDVHNEQSISTDRENNEVITNVMSSKYGVSGNGGFNVAMTTTTADEDDTDC